MFRYLIIMLLLALGPMACGKTGDLYLPDETEPEQQQNTKQ